jgi:hypothetical protein
LRVTAASNKVLCNLQLEADMLTVNSCPPDVEEVADLFCMNRLDEIAAREFREHCEICPECADVVDQAREIIRAIRGALAENPLAFICRLPPMTFN